ncbi:hypothetical protein QBC39DRAFT_356656 [Podospora conica]|nr:hypothetical protein QBC39DRAFT_356656 [Schizothecium conicum]
MVLVKPARYHLTTKPNLSYGGNQVIDPQRLPWCFDLKPATGMATINNTIHSTGSPPCNEYVTKLKSALKSVLPPTPGATNLWILAAFEKIICQEVNELLGKISQRLDTIDLGLYDDDNLRESATVWRSQLGNWRNVLHHQTRGLVAVSPNFILESPSFSKTRKGLADETDRMGRHIDATITTLLLSSQVANKASIHGPPIPPRLPSTLGRERKRARHAPEA